MHYTTSFLTLTAVSRQGLGSGRSVLVRVPGYQLILGMISIPVLQNNRHDAEPGITHFGKGQSPEHTTNNTKPVQDNAPEEIEQGAECEGFIPEKSVSQARP